MNHDELNQVRAKIDATQTSVRESLKNQQELKAEDDDFIRLLWNQYQHGFTGSTKRKTLSTGNRGEPSFEDPPGKKLQKMTVTVTESPLRQYGPLSPSESPEKRSNTHYQPSVLIDMGVYGCASASRQAKITAYLAEVRQFLTGKKELSAECLEDIFECLRRLRLFFLGVPKPLEIREKHFILNRVLYIRSESAHQREWAYVYTGLFTGVWMPCQSQTDISRAEERAMHSCRMHLCRKKLADLDQMRQEAELSDNIERLKRVENQMIAILERVGYPFHASEEDKKHHEIVYGCAWFESHYPGLSGSLHVK